MFYRTISLILVLVYLIISVELFYVRSDYLFYLTLPWSLIIALGNSMNHSGDGLLIYFLMLIGAVLNSLLFLILLNKGRKNLTTDGHR